VSDCAKTRTRKTTLPFYCRKPREHTGKCSPYTLAPLPREQWEAPAPNHCECGACECGCPGCKERMAAEWRRVVRVFQRYTSEERMNRAASHRLGHRQREAVGEFYYTHPAVPGLAFETRGRAARAGLAALTGEAGP
jgi:hypothetical protein